MITVMLTTARPAKCYHHHPEWNQFLVLARCLVQQTYRDFELVVTSPYVETVRQTLQGAPFSVSVAAPRETPWRRERCFCVASALNTSIAQANGDWLVPLGDGMTILPDYLERHARWHERGIAVASLYTNVDSANPDNREKWFDRQRGSAPHTMILPGASPPPQGSTSFPRHVAINVLNGYDEHFDGSRGLEDMDFGLRLQLAGVPVVMDRHCRVFCHETSGYEPRYVADDGNHVLRCCNAAWTMARRRGHLRANTVPYTRTEAEEIVDCHLRDQGRHCTYWAHLPLCEYTHLYGGHPTARRIMLEEKEPTVDLAVEWEKLHC